MYIFVCVLSSIVTPLSPYGIYICNINSMYIEPCVSDISSGSRLRSAISQLV